MIDLLTPIKIIAAAINPQACQRPVILMRRSDKNAAMNCRITEIVRMMVDVIQ